MEIPPVPQEMHLDFLCVVLGVIFIGLPVYIFFFREGSIDLIKSLLLLVFVSTGAPFLLFGFSEMIKNYFIENKLTNLRAKKETLKLNLDIQKLEKKASKNKPIQQL